MKRIISILTTLLLVSNIFAQSPEEISYQAVIRDGSNKLVANQPVGMRISILQGSTTGTVIYAETQTPTTNVDGLVSIAIGTGTTSDNFSAIDWSAGPYFIKTETDPNGGANYTITGTSQLLSVPYALYAKTAENGAKGSNLDNIKTSPNIKIGTGAGMNNPDSISIVAVGDSALFHNGEDSSIYIYQAKFNTAVGSKALFANTAGYGNTAFGFHALQSVTTGPGNDAFGEGALNSNTTGSFNIANGYHALFRNTTGFNNIGIGDNALYTNTTGYSNIAIGIQPLKYDTSGYNNIAIGTDALENNTSGTYNTAIGIAALFSNTTGTGNVAVGSSAGPTTSDLSNTGAFGNGAQVTASNTIQIGNSSITQIGGQVAWSNLSDGRFKTNVKANVPGLDFIMKLRPVTFSWDMDKLDAFKGVNDSSYTPEMLKARKEKETKVYTGFIAQEVEKAADSCNYDFSGVIKPANNKTPYNLSYAEFVVPLVKAVQEQEQTINTLKQQNEKMQAENEKIQAENGKMQAENKKMQAEIQLLKQAINK